MNNQTMINRLSSGSDHLRVGGVRSLWLAINAHLFGNRETWAREHVRLAAEREPLTVAEVGVWEGDHAAALQKQLEIETMYLIDPYEEYDDYEGEKNISVRLEEAQERAQRQLEPYDGVQHLEARSVDAAESISKSLDYVYIDANHQYEYVKQDIEAYYDLLNPGGILAGHDFNGYHPGVIRAVLGFAETNCIEMRTTRFGDDWFVVKPEVCG